jgi:60 kDa SS-A/Ro ribonucleoprotein
MIMIRPNRVRPEAREDLAEQELRRMLFACARVGKLEQRTPELAIRVAEILRNVECEKAAALAIEARGEKKLRRMSLLLTREMARQKGHRRLVADTLCRVIQSPADLTDFVALYWENGRVPLSAQVKKGLAAAFPKFKEHELAEYADDGPVKLRDVLFLCHAKPRDESQAATWKRLTWGRLVSPKS